MPMGDREPREPRLIQEGEVFDPEDARRGILRRPDPPEPRPEPPLAEQHEPWARLADLTRSHPVRDWVKRRMRHGDQ